MIQSSCPTSFLKRFFSRDAIWFEWRELSEHCIRIQRIELSAAVSTSCREHSSIYVETLTHNY